MSDMISKQALLECEKRMRANQESIKSDMETSDHHIYWKAVGKLELLDYLKKVINSGALNGSSKQEAESMLETLRYSSEMLELIAYGNPDINEVRQTARETLKEIDKALSPHTETGIQKVQEEGYLYQVSYDNDYKTWLEARSSHWMKDQAEVQQFLDNLHHKTKYAKNIKVRMLVDGTSRFTIPGITDGGNDNENR